MSLIRSPERLLWGKLSQVRGSFPTESASALFLGGALPAGASRGLGNYNFSLPSFSVTRANTALPYVIIKVSVGFFVITDEAIQVFPSCQGYTGTRILITLAISPHTDFVNTSMSQGSVDRNKRPKCMNGEGHCCTRFPCSPWRGAISALTFLDLKI